jgi:hypothetical protein
VTALVWDKVGERRYETGIDRGVLYLTDGSAFPWNGLASITENRSRESKSYYIDGIKHQEHVIPGEYSAKLTAYTYPDQLDSLLGNADFAPGVTVYDQPTKMFHLSYRTGIANDLLGFEYGYKVHIVYNIVATPNDVAYDTLGESVSAKPFDWDLKGIPNYLAGFRASNHISVDSRTVNPVVLAGLEAHLYGSDTEDPLLPPFVDLLEMVASL